VWAPTYIQSIKGGRRPDCPPGSASDYILRAVMIGASERLKKRSHYGCEVMFGVDERYL